MPRPHSACTEEGLRLLWAIHLSHGHTTLAHVHSPVPWSSPVCCWIILPQPKRRLQYVTTKHSPVSAIYWMWMSISVMSCLIFWLILTLWGSPTIIVNETRGLCLFNLGCSEHTSSFVCRLLLPSFSSLAVCKSEEDLAYEVIFAWHTGQMANFKNK